jgi:hypothetical protein
MAQNKIVIAPDTTTVIVSTVGLNGQPGTPGGEAFPYTGSAIVSGSLGVIGETNITGSIEVSDSATFKNGIENTGSIDIKNGHVNIESNSYFLQGTSVGGNNVSLIGVDSNDNVYIGNQGYNTTLQDTITSGSAIVSGSLNVTGSIQVEGTIIATQITSSVVHSGSNYLVASPVSGDTDETTILTGSVYDNISLVKVTHQRGTNGTFTIQLPDVTAGNSINRTIRFISDSSVDNTHQIDISPSGSQTLDGGGAFSMDRSYEGIMIWSDGVEWFKIQAKNI